MTQRVVHELCTPATLCRHCTHRLAIIDSCPKKGGDRTLSQLVVLSQRALPTLRAVLSLDLQNFLLVQTALHILQSKSSAAATTTAA